MTGSSSKIICRIVRVYTASDLKTAWIRAKGQHGLGFCSLEVFRIRTVQKDNMSSLQTFFFI